jgi:hypothetical protein
MATETANGLIRSHLSAMVKPIQANPFFHPYVSLGAFGSGIKPIRECLKELLDAIIIPLTFELEYGIKFTTQDIDTCKKEIFKVFEEKLDLDYKQP